MPRCAFSSSRWARSTACTPRPISAARAGATRGGHILATGLLDHYRATLQELERVGYAPYAAAHLRPYLTAAAAQFSPGRRTRTERLLERFRRRSSA